MDEEIRKELDQITKDELDEDLSSLSVEDIMQDGFTREAAEAIWEAEHGIGLTHCSSFEDFCKKLEEM